MQRFLFVCILILPRATVITSCDAQPEGQLFSSMDSQPYNQLSLNWQGACRQNDAWTFYLVLYGDSTGMQCDDYTLTVDFPYSSFSGDADCEF